MIDAEGTAKQMFLTYQKNLPLMLQACKTPGQHDQVIDAYVSARDGYYGCIAKAFNQNDPVLKDLVTQAVTVTASLNKIGDQLADIAKLIGYATQAATIAGKLAAL